MCEKSVRIEELLARRSDLSTFLVHLTRTKDEVMAKDRLKQILSSMTLLAETAMGHAVDPLVKAKKASDSQKCVSFTETPLQHVALLMGKIAGRKFQFESYGVAITKKQGRINGVNPVWYVDITPNHHWLSNSINALVETAIEKGAFDESPIASLTPFIEQMGHGDGYRKEFWWEREWRANRDFPLPLNLIVLCPADEVPEFKAVIEKHDTVPPKVEFLDPRWSLEQIIARFAGFSDEQVGPF